MTVEVSKLNLQAPFVLREGNLRSLHFTLGEVQSAMNADRPDELQIDYTRTMMGFLLLVPRPRRIAMIGLGGGSLAKFCHRHIPFARITAVENNPGVIALRDEFAIPPDDARWSVVEDDGAAFVAASDCLFDVLLVDGFDQAGQPAQLGSERFYDGCRRALAPGGVLVVNLHADDAGHAACQQRIAASFKGNAMEVLAAEKSNCIVFAARGRTVDLPALRDRAWSDALDPLAQRQLRGEFARIGWSASALPTAAA